MDVEILIPQAPVPVVPGQETRVTVQLHNRAAAPVSVRLSLGRGRAGAWAQVEPAATALAAGEGVAVDIVFRPPPGTAPSATVQPFTLQADDIQYGETAGRATGLLTVTAPERLAATLTPLPSGRGGTTFQLDLANRTGARLTLRLSARLDPPAGQATVQPAILDIPAGQAATAQVLARPRVRLAGAPTPYVVAVECADAAAEPVGTAQPGTAVLTTVEAPLTVPARIGRRPATVLVTALLVVVAGVAVLAGRGFLGGGDGDAPPGAGPPPGAGDVRTPYALVDVFPHQDGPAGRGAADATLSRLTSAGMPVRLVDSTTSQVVADGQGGLWVLLRDGFATAAEAQAFCDQYRIVAPKCEVVSS